MYDTVLSSGHKVVHKSLAFTHPALLKFHTPVSPIPPAPGNHTSSACLHDFELSFIYIYLYIYNTFIYSFQWNGSSLLHKGLLQLREHRAPSRCGVQASRCSGFSCGAWAFRLQQPHMGFSNKWHTGLVAPEHKGSSQTRNPNRCPLHYQADS